MFSEAYKNCNLMVYKDIGIDKVPIEQLTDYRKHSHDKVQLIYVEKGHAVIIVENIFYTIFENYYIWIPAHVQHKTISNPNSILTSLYIDSRLCINIKPGVNIMLATPLLIELINKCASNDEAFFNTKALRHIAELVLLEVTISTKIEISLPLPTDKRLISICKKLLEDPLHLHTLDELLIDIPISYRHAIRLFKSETGMCFNKWRTTLKLHVSASMISRGKSSTYVAYETGYKNLSGFSAAFKKQFGTSPKNYIRT